MTVTSPSTIKEITALCESQAVISFCYENKKLYL